MSAEMTAVVVAAVAGLAVGALVNATAGRFPWDRAAAQPAAGPGGGVAVAARARPAVRLPIVEVATAALFALTTLRFGVSWELPAFLALAVAAVLLTVIDLRHRLLPNGVVLPALGAGAVLLAIAAAGLEEWSALLRAGLGAVVLFAGYLLLALISPRGLGMGDVKLAALLGLYLGWLGWGAVALGAAAGFLVQAVVALALLVTRRIGLKGELPFGPAMLLGAALVIGWSESLLG